MTSDLQPILTETRRQLQVCQAENNMLRRERERFIDGQAVLTLERNTALERLKRFESLPEPLSMIEQKTDWFLERQKSRKHEEELLKQVNTLTEQLEDARKGDKSIYTHRDRLLKENKEIKQREAMMVFAFERMESELADAKMELLKLRDRGKGD